MTKKILSKGYTLIIDSWENDADNRRTERITVDSHEKAKAIYELCAELFGKTYHNGGIGNLHSDRELKNNKEKIIEFMKAHSILLDGYRVDTDDDLVDVCREWGYKLTGYSDFYDFRVVEKCEVVYSKADIYVEEMTELKYER